MKNPDYLEHYGVKGMRWEKKPLAVFFTGPFATKVIKADEKRRGVSSS